jgi:hypothetical protein
VTASQAAAGDTEPPAAAAPPEPDPPPGKATAWAAAHSLDRLYAGDVAVLAGRPGHPLKLATVARYKAVAAANRRAGAPGLRDLPEPDGEDPAPGGGIPLAWWWPATLDPWMNVRQAGPGRPPRGGGPPATRTHPDDRARPGPKPRPAQPPVTGENPHDPNPDPGPDPAA